jgi:uncharacterized membrane protein (DUF4010 family)
VSAITAYLNARRANNSEGDVNAGREPAFGVFTALGLAGLMGVMMVAVAALQAWFGGTAVLAGATVAGFIDARASAVSVASLVASGQVPPREAVVPILAGFSANQVTKVVIASGAGPSGFAFRTLPGMVIMLAASWTAALLPVWKG